MTLFRGQLPSALTSSRFTWTAAETQILRELLLTVRPAGSGEALDITKLRQEIPLDQVWRVLDWGPALEESTAAGMTVREIMTPKVLRKLAALWKKEISGSVSHAEPVSVHVPVPELVSEVEPRRKSTRDKTKVIQKHKSDPKISLGSKIEIVPIVPNSSRALRSTSGALEPISNSMAEPASKLATVSKSNSGSKIEPAMRSEIHKVKGLTVSPVSPVGPVVDVKSIASASSVEPNTIVQPMPQHSPETEEDPNSPGTVAARARAHTSMAFLRQRRKRSHQPSYTFSSSRRAVCKVSLIPVPQELYNSLIKSTSTSTLESQPPPYHLCLDISIPMRRRHAQPVHRPTPLILQEDSSNAFSAFVHRAASQIHSFLIFIGKFLLALVCLLTIEFCLLYSITISYKYIVYYEEYRPRLLPRYGYHAVPRFRLE